MVSPALDAGVRHREWTLRAVLRQISPRSSVGLHQVYSRTHCWTVVSWPNDTRRQQYACYSVCRSSRHRDRHTDKRVVPRNTASLLLRRRGDYYSMFCALAPYTNVAPHRSVWAFVERRKRARVVAIRGLAGLTHYGVGREEAVFDVPATVGCTLGGISCSSRLCNMCHYMSATPRSEILCVAASAVCRCPLLCAPDSHEHPIEGSSECVGFREASAPPWLTPEVGVATHKQAERPHQRRPKTLLGQPLRSPARSPPELLERTAF